MELHLVHLNINDENVQNKIAVIGVMFKLGSPDAFLSKVLFVSQLSCLNSYPNLKKKKKIISKYFINVTSLQ